MLEVTLKDPGLVENGPDGMSCLHSCIQMAMRTRTGSEVFSFDKINAILRREDGYYSWEYAIIVKLLELDFDVKLIQQFDLERLVASPKEYILEFFGEEAGKVQIKKSKLDIIVEDAKKLLSFKDKVIEKRTPSTDDIKTLINEGYYAIPFVNQRILQADHGYSAHGILVYGYSSRGVRIHNPGPPATRATELAWDLFKKAWDSPKPESRILLAIR